MTQTVLLGDEIELIGGGTPKTSNKEYWEGNIPWLSVVDFGGSSHWVETAEKKITELGLRNSSTKLLNINDIIISARGTVGELAQLKQPMAFNQSCYGVRAKKSIDQNYLYYLLKLSITDLQRHAHGGVFSTITKDTFQHIKVRLPAIDVQKEIANILGTLDEKIELNRQMNETLERMGQALFRHYFIDNPEAEKWRQGTAGDLFKLTMGLSPKGESYNETEKGALLLNGAADFTDNKITPKRWTSAPTRISKSGDIIFCIRGTIGNVAIGYDKYCLGRGVAAMTPNKNSTGYVYFSTIHSINEMESAASGSVIRGLSKPDISGRKIVVPSDNALNSFEIIALPVINKLRINSEEIQTLTNLRDTLLPRLISGKIKV